MAIVIEQPQRMEMDILNQGPTQVAKKLHYLMLMKKATLNHIVKKILMNTLKTLQLSKEHIQNSQVGK